MGAEVRSQVASASKSWGDQKRTPWILFEKSFRFFSFYALAGWFLYEGLIKILAKGNSGAIKSVQSQLQREQPERKLATHPL